MFSKDSNIASAQAQLTFSGIRMNIGGAWKSASNIVNITVSGIYLVYMDISSCTSFFSGGATAEIMLNNKIAFWVQNALQVGTLGGQMRNHASILRLNVGNTLFVRIPATPSVCYTSASSASTYLTSFSGLLLALT